ncbi:schwannomin-interacting protein 1 homolog isoform X1 [Dendroctonus ponderosae]|nr:schwannomin-interacting protein 1 homolog isoform X1 [Dendroctonus ponderosae]
MRLKSSDGQLQAIHNRNNAILHSPKRLNTAQNSNNKTQFSTTTTLAAAQYKHATTQEISNISASTQQLTIEEVAALNVQIVTQELRWCNSDQQPVQFNINRRNINGTLAAQLRLRAFPKDELLMPQSPDDALGDDDEALQSSSSSASGSPQDEDHPFEPSDDSSDEGNDYSQHSNSADMMQAPLKGFVNPNYPGFQHLAHTLDFDEDCLNNANNNNEEYGVCDKFDSVNRLDSVENIQKVFHDKSLDLDVAPLPDSPNSDCLSSDCSADSAITVNESFNIRVDESKVFESEKRGEPNVGSVVGDFRKEVEEELGKVCSVKQQVLDESHTVVVHEVTTPESVVLQQKKEATLAKMAKKSCKTMDNCPNQPKQERRIGRQVPSFLPLSQKSLPATPQEMLSPIESSGRIVKPAVNHSEPADKKPETLRRDSNRELEEIEIQIKKIKSDTMNSLGQLDQFRKEDFTKQFREKDEDSSAMKSNNYAKKRRDYNQQFGSLITFPKRQSIKRDPVNRRSVPMVRDRKKLCNPELFGAFDVYNIETAMPKIDLEAIESHLKAAKEEERRRRTDREEIRRRLAMGNEDDYYTDRPGRKPSLQARLQSGMNLQICFMNETVSDNESPSSDNECPLTNPKPTKNSRPNQNSQASGPQPQRPATLSLHPIPPPQLGAAAAETDFFTKQARLQTEARMALAQAKEMARMQMEIEKQKQKKSPITEMVRHSLEKVGIPFPEEKRRLSRQILTEMNVAQLQVIVNDLHTQIETLNEQLVKFLMDRDDLHMEQDSKLVDIEDLTRYLGAKEQVLKDQGPVPTPQNNNIPPSPAPSSPLTSLNNSVRPHLNRIASLVKK